MRTFLRGRLTLAALCLLTALSNQNLNAQDSLGINKVGELRFDWDRAYDVAFAGQYAYIADGWAGLRIVNITNPRQPVETGGFRTPGEATIVAVQGNYAFIGGNEITEVLLDARGYLHRKDGFYIVDISDPASPRVIALWDSTTNIKDIVTIGHYVVVGRAGSDEDLNRLHIIDFEDPDRMFIASRLRLTGTPNEMELIGEELFLVTDSGLQSILLTDPVNPAYAHDYRLDDNQYQIAHYDNRIYTLEWHNNLTIFQLDQNRLSLIGSFEFGNDRAYSSSLNVGNGIAVVGQYSSDNNNSPIFNYYSVLDVSDPEHVTELSSTICETRLEEGVIVEGIGLFAADVGGLIAFNLSNPAQPEKIGQYVRPGDVKRLWVEGEVAYLAHGDGGWSSIEIESLDNPLLISLEQSDRVSGIVKAGGYLYTGGTRFRSFDVSNPGQPTLKTDWYDNYGWRISELGYSGSYLFATGESGTNIFDLNVPDRPASIGSIYGLHPVQDGNMVITVGSKGVQVFDITHPARTVELAYYQTQWQTHDVAIRDSLAFVACSFEGEVVGGLQVISYRDPYRLEEVGFLELPSGARGISLSDEFAFIAVGDSGLMIIEITDPTNPRATGRYDTPGRALEVAAVGVNAFVADSLFFGIYDCSEAMGREERSLRRVSLPDEFITAYPNPFNSAATISFSIAKAGNVTLKAYDAKGRQVFDLSPTSPQQSGKHDIHWDAAMLPSGRYFLRLEAEGMITGQPISIVR